MPSPEEILRANEEARASATTPYTILDAVMDARFHRGQQEEILGGPQARRIIVGLLSALEQSPCYLKAVITGHRTFVLVDWDRAAPYAILEWCKRAMDHNCRPDKVEEARRMSTAWNAQDQMQTKWPD